MISCTAFLDSGSVRMPDLRIRFSRTVADKWRAITVNAWKAVRSAVSFVFEIDDNNILHSYQSFKTISYYMELIYVLTARIRDRLARRPWILALLNSSSTESPLSRGCSSLHV